MKDKIAKVIDMAKCVSDRSVWICSNCGTILDSDKISKSEPEKYRFCFNCGIKLVF